MKKIIPFRISEPILLGFFSNLIVNIVFNPTEPNKWWSRQEIIVAIIFCTLITESNRFVEKKLETKYQWNVDTKKRFLFQLFYVSLILLFLVNVLGRIYHWLIGDEFYLLNEIIIINLIIFIITFFLVVFKWTSFFYKKWKTSEINLQENKVKIEKLSSNIKQANASIKVRKKNSDYFVKAENVRIVLSELGVVKVFTNTNESYTFNGTLNKISSLLPENLFFPVTRNSIVHHQQIISLTPSTYGKIEVKIKNNHSKESVITVSRLKAAAFRKWYHSTSSINL